MVNSKFLLPSLNRERYHVLWYCNSAKSYPYVPSLGRCDCPPESPVLLFSSQYQSPYTFTDCLASCNTGIKEGVVETLQTWLPCTVQWAKICIRILQNGEPHSRAIWSGLNGTQQESGVTLKIFIMSGKLVSYSVESIMKVFQFMDLLQPLDTTKECTSLQLCMPQQTCIHPQHPHR